MNLQSQVAKIKEEKDKENAELLISVLDGFIDDTEEDKECGKGRNCKEENSWNCARFQDLIVSNPSEKQAKVNKNKKVIEARLPKRLNHPRRNPQPNPHDMVYF